MMKNKFKKAASVIMSISMLIALSACSVNREEPTHTDTEPASATAQPVENNTSPETAAQPPQSDVNTDTETSDEDPGTGGDENSEYNQPGYVLFDSIPWSLMDFAPIDEVNKWLDSDLNGVNFFNDIPTSIKDYHNIYSFITDFGITKEQAREGLKDRMEPDPVDPRYVITEEEFEILFCGDLAKITETFASEYSIAVGEKIYCPHWLYTHSIEDYKAAGITPEMLKEKAEKFPNFFISESVKTQFYERLSEYCGEPINMPSEAAHNEEVVESFPKDSADFYRLGNSALDNVPVSLTKRRDDEKVTKWMSSQQDLFENPPDSLEGYTNIYSFIKAFNISEAEAREALKYRLESDDPQNRITEEEFDTLFSGDLEKVTQTFASPYSIVVGEKIYCPNWLYIHSIEDYKAAGIPPEILKEKAEKFPTFQISESEKAQFLEKVAEYCGE